MHLEMLLTLPRYDDAMFAFASAVEHVNPGYDMELVKMNPEDKPAKTIRSL